MRVVTMFCLFNATCLFWARKLGYIGNKDIWGFVAFVAFGVISAMTEYGQKYSQSIT